MPAQTYRILVEGEVDDDVSGAIEAMTISHEEGITTMVGTFRDQAELQGLLQRIAGLGLTLLGASTVEDEGAE